jgi:hypothetical protein
MQENEFEKKIRETMEEFKITPPDSVWEKVEQHIPKRERRRRWMILMFLFAGLVVSGYFVYDHYQHSAPTQKVTFNKNNKTKIDSTHNKKNAEQDAAVITHQKKESKNMKEAEHKNSFSKTFKKATLLSTAKNEQQHNAITEQQAQAPVVNENVDKTKDETSIIINEEKNINDSINRNTTTFNAANEQKDTLNKQVLKDSTRTENIAGTNKKSSPKQTVSKKWQIGVTAFYGRSDMFENLTTVPASYSADQTGLSGFQRAARSFPNSANTKGAFSIGATVKKNLSAKSSLLIGIQYSKYQTEIETGSMKDTNATFLYNNLNGAPTTDLNNFYKPGSGYPYKNNYSFIQIPILYEHSLLKNKLLNLNGGIIFSRLISSNALVYDSYNEAYYNNNYLFRKTQVSLLAGINTQFNLGKTSVGLGPQFRYGLTNLFKRNNYGSQHLFSWGLQANIFLKK